MSNLRGQIWFISGPLISALFVSICLHFALASAAIASDQPAIGPDIPVANDLTVEDDGTQARLVFSISAPLAAQAFVLAHPNRLIIDLPRTLFQLDPDIGKTRLQRRKGATHVFAKPQRLIGSFRFGLLAQDKSRIVIDLAEPASLVKAESEFDVSSGRNQLVIELRKTDLTSFLQSAQASRLNMLVKVQNTQTSPAVDMKPEPGHHDLLNKARPVIVIDPGHGGIDSGAIAKGLIEKDLVFEFAKVLQRKLEALDHYNIVMTRDGDIFVLLHERVKIARDVEASLLISIHADSLPENNENVEGATVYTSSGRASDAEAARVADSENQADAIAGVDKEEDSNEVTDILFDLARRETRTLSRIFAQTIVDHWKKAGRLNKNPQRSAGFRVLGSPDVPSVLLELGYLSNSKDSLAIASPEWRDKAAEKVTEAVENFFLDHPAFSVLGASQPPSRGQEKLDLRKLIEEDEAPAAGPLAGELPPINR